MPTEKKYMDRVNRLKERVLKTYPEIDMENAIILTRGFQESEGKPPVVQKAYAFRKQCMEKTIKIWDDELIVGNAGSKQRGGLVCPDDCWTFLDREIDTINERKYDPFHLKKEDKKDFLEIVKPYWKGRSIYEKWSEQIPEETRTLRDCGVLYIDRKAVRGWGELTVDYELIIKEGIEGLEKRIAKVKSTLDITIPDDYEKIVYLQALSYCADGLRQLGKRYSAEALRLANMEKDEARKKELLQIAETCDRVPEKPARTFREAIQ
ncbi:MAG: pyruvate formate lyase family protein [Lachnospiraceae bacterium]